MRLVQGVALLAAAIAVVASDSAQAQGDYPTRPISLVVPVPPGGAADFLARTVGAKLHEAMGQPVVIVNRGGAGGTIASASVAKADPDGYTLLLNSITTHGIGPHLYPNLTYDSMKDFIPIGLVAKLPLIMTINATVPAKTVAEVVALAKGKPGALAFASSGNGGAPHVAGELFKRLTGTDLLHVPYRGSGPAVVDLVAGRTAIMFDAAPSLLPFVQTDKLRPLAAASAERNRLLPDIPTFAELGFAGMEISLWYGIVAPHGTPLAIVRKLNAQLVKVLAMSEVRETLAKQGADATPGSPEQFAAFMREEHARWGAVVKDAGIKASD
jgi:tripartite-type tricarboxylate transporter receptor subunit TctC